MIQVKQIPNSCSDREISPPTRGRYCDQHIAKFTDRIRTPGFPGGYGPNEKCVYTIHRTDPRICQVEMEFLEFDLEGGWSRCDKDFLELPDGSRLCDATHGQKRRLDFPRDGNILMLKFISDSYGSRRGFDIAVRQVLDSCRVPVLPPSGGRCEQEVITTSGQITSPGFPNNYGPNENCIFTIRRADSTVCSIVLDIQHFDLENDKGGCSNDYLEFPDLTRLCGRYSGRKTVNIPRGLDSVTLLFVSDGYVFGRGFKIYVNQILGSCGDLPSVGDCNQEITSFKGTFTSPSYPYDYSANQKCTYTIHKGDPSVCVVEIDFLQFDIENSRDNCSRDFLELPEGNRLCGPISGTRLVEFPVGRHSITMTFYSDNYGTGRGFELSVSQRRNSCGSVPSRCGQEITGVSGRFSSPSFPQRYGPGLQCRYTIRRPDPLTCKVKLTLRDVDIEYSATCNNDYLELPDKERICGTQVPRLKTYEYNLASGAVMVLYFVTDNYGSGKGFDLEIYQVPNSCSVSPSFVQCNQLITEEKDVIRSPNYPKDYLPSVRCEYEIKRFTASTCHVQLEFLDFDVETEQNCKADFLEIQSSKERLCGHHQQPTRVIPFPTGSESLSFVFSSDRYTNRRGFNIQVTQLKGSCYNPIVNTITCATLRDVSGVMQSNNYPGPYNPNTNCYYKIFRHSNAVCRLEVYFSRFDVGHVKDRGCDEDYLEIHGLRYCGLLDGQTVQVPFPETKSEVDFHFRTDESDQRTGFRIEVKQVTQGCEEDISSNGCDATFSKETFHILSPEYRNKAYPSNIDCQYTVKKVKFDVCAIEIKYNNFHLEDSEDCTNDYLQIDDLKVCGKIPHNSVRTYQFPADELIIRLHTDTYVNEKGFFLTAKQISC
ncbi:cubilin-like isoform X1 [Limulus polyphemus]|uniref:Cubilin-like isoform X1 n=1 Tax=Limulus polyphemus TaxID=6850 RepID=A0ABM1BIA8_LIMPO|nr:cubilin-like isoform X1 [Limulus polyphemus]